MQKRANSLLENELLNYYTASHFIIEGEARGDWSLLKQKGEWQLYWGTDVNVTTQISLNQDTAWQLFTKGLSVNEARNRIRIEGNTVLGSGILRMVSIMA